MAVTRAGTVIKTDADQDVIKGPLDIVGFCYVGTADSSFDLLAGGSSGNELIFITGNENKIQHIEFRCQDDIYVSKGGTGGELWLYTRVK